MSYVALYRKYRPKSFDDIVGQDAIVTTLKNQLSSGKIGHAYLFCGMRGTGKTSTARVFAKALNCEKGPTQNPCNSCASCIAISNGSMMDVIEMDAASNRGIDDIRDLREKVNFAPSEGRYKIYIIDEVHMLTTEAFNALLKTLEEPPQYVVFILATTEPNKLPQTILSRCMRFDFTRISTAQIVTRLREIAMDSGIEVEDKALAQIARSSQGSVRDALSLLDKAIAYSEGKLSYDETLTLLGAVSHEVFYDISQAVLQCSSAAVLEILDQVAKQGKDLFRFMDDLLEHFRNLLMVCINADRNLIDVIDEDYVKLQQTSQGYSKEKLLSIIGILKDAANDVKWSSQPRIIVEAALVKLTLLDLWEKEEGYISRIQHLEEQVAALQKQLESININQPILKSPDQSNSIKQENVPSPRENASLTKPANHQNMTLIENKDVPENQTEPQKPKKQTTNADDTNVTRLLQKDWPKVLESLSSQRKMTLLSTLKAGGVVPAKVDQSKLYLLNNGGAVYEEIILAEKHTIEEIIKQVSNVDITIKGFISEESISQDEAESQQTDEFAKKDEELSDEEFSRKVIELFGKDNVTFIDE
ncbi:MAG: DNA polymerase III subunit gamma/tau [Thermoanaerobacteraceae bacterium]|nr:DNA polymerase III subunit gamma/tau [Thermoanaerobacteraceae bacterium]